MESESKFSAGNKRLPPLLPESKGSECSQLMIYSLGRFQVLRGGEVLSATSGHDGKAWELCKYLLARGGKAVSREELIDHLWPGENSRSESALHTLADRLCRQLQRKQSAGNELPYIISPPEGYAWNTEASYWWDAAAFEELCREAYAALETDPLISIDKFQQALQLYRGDFWAGSAGWAAVAASYYRRLYMDSVYELIKLLREQNKPDEVYKTCEEALQIDPFAEELHCMYLSTLLEEGRSRQALAHYEYVTSLLYREMGVKPSAALQDLYRRIKKQETNLEPDLSLIEEDFQEHRETGGAFFCDIDTFHRLYRLERRRLPRNGQSVILSLLTITDDSYSCLETSTLHSLKKILKEVLLLNLRQGDVVSSRRDDQFLLLLHGLSYEQAEKVISRIQTSFLRSCGDEKIFLRGLLQPLSAPLS